MDFVALRQLAGFTRKEIATLCAVTERTVRNWEQHITTPPRAIILLLHLADGQLGTLDAAWHGWCIRRGHLWAPQLLGKGFTPQHLKTYEYVWQERDALRRELAQARRPEIPSKDQFLPRGAVRPVSLPRPRYPDPATATPTDCPPGTRHGAQQAQSPTPCCGRSEDPSRAFRAAKASPKPEREAVATGQPAHSGRKAKRSSGWKTVPLEALHSGSPLVRLGSCSTDAALVAALRCRLVGRTERDRGSLERFQGGNGSGDGEHRSVGDRKLGPLLVSHTAEAAQNQRPAPGQMIQRADCFREGVVLHEDGAVVQVPVILDLQRLDDVRRFDQLRHVGLNALHLAVKPDQLSATNLGQTLHGSWHEYTSEESDDAAVDPDRLNANNEATIGDDAVRSLDAPASASYTKSYLLCAIRKRKDCL
ncbi:hypothetical protein [Immundisolibacter sp.]|uniref:hypothetical protein n=1 Tax=Immundisolibacter sp. TaxID=1934948 RepID=UPI003564199B